jgi:low affinity Fe/Cu permease
MDDIFRKIAHRTSQLMGNSWAFIWAVVIIVVWAVSGPLFNFSDTWQLIINTGTTILTFLMVFLIQNTQNRDAHAIHLKLDELIKATGAARNLLIDAEDMSDAELERMRKEFKDFCEQKAQSVEE